MSEAKYGSTDATGVPAQESPLRRVAIASAWKMASRWKAPIGFALLDQGMTSVANFALFTIAARVLPIDEFGKYSIVWAFSMLVVPIATALLVEPLPAIVSSRRPSIRTPLLAAAARLSFLMGCVLAALIAIAGLGAWAWSPTVAVLLLCLAVASPLQQLQFASRRFCYLLRREGVAAASAAAYATVLVGGVVGLWASALCTAPGLILLSGAASLAAAAVGVATGCVPLSKMRRPLRAWLMRQCWLSGKWLAGSSIAVWTSSFIVLPVAAVIVGPSASGILRAQSTLIMPIYQFSWAMGALLIPRVAEVSIKKPVNRLRVTALQTIAILAVLATGYSAVILIWGSDVLALAYHKPEITAAARLFWPLSISAILDSVTSAIAIVLIANAVTRFIFWARVASGAVILSGALLLGPTFGLDAIAWSVTVGSAICAFIHVLALAKASRSRHSRAEFAALGTDCPPGVAGRRTS